MVEFNPDGSLKLPGYMQRARDSEFNKFNNSACIKIDKKVVSFVTPKKCILTIQLSNKMQRNDFVYNMFRFFNERAETPLNFFKKSEKEFEIQIGSSFKRCQECTSLTNRYREYIDGNFILNKNNCPYEPPQFFGTNFD